MKIAGQFFYFVYITTNPNRTVLYTGVTNNLIRRLSEHASDTTNLRRSFAGKYFCDNLIYYEVHQYIKDAIAREKEIKGWRRSKKEKLITDFNPEWKFLNTEIRQH